MVLDLLDCLIFFFCFHFLLDNQIGFIIQIEVKEEWQIVLRN